MAAYIPFPGSVGSKRAGRQAHAGQSVALEALDFLSRILKAGHSLTTGLQMMSEELPMPLAGEFRRCYDQHSLGQSLDDSLKEAATPHRIHGLRLFRHRGAHPSAAPAATCRKCSRISVT